MTELRYFVQLTFNKILYFIPLCLTLNCMCGGRINVYLNSPWKIVLFMGDILHGNVGSIILSNKISFAKCRTKNAIIISARVVDYDAMTRSNSL